MRYADRIAEQINKLGDCPLPSDAAIKHSEQLYNHITTKLQQAPMPFVEFMQELLYAPGLGYYSAGSTKLGAEGDFITAPEISPYFGRALANQCHQLFSVVQNPELASILEFGAGTGKLAADVLDGLKELNSLPCHYYILEVSADLIARQQQLLKARHPEFYEQITWLDALPDDFQGVMLANEVLDAMPVHRFRMTEQGIAEEFVYLDEQGDWQISGDTKLSDSLKNWFARESSLALDISAPYQSEVNLAQESWLKGLSNSLTSGAIILIDYGFPQAEYYHPERSAGTLMCHYRHRAHDNPLCLAGLQDITAHVDFTAVAETALAVELEVLGYTNQASFLMGCGILQLAEQATASATDCDIENEIENEIDSESDNVKQQLAVSGQLRQLMMPEEMGELFKVMVLSKAIDLTTAIGFSFSDLRHQL